MKIGRLDLKSIGLQKKSSSSSSSSSCSSSRCAIGETPPLCFTAVMAARLMEFDVPPSESQIQTTEAKEFNNKRSNEFQQRSYTSYRCSLHLPDHRPQVPHPLPRPLRIWVVQFSQAFSGIFDSVGPQWERVPQSSMFELLGFWFSCLCRATKNHNNNYWSTNITSRYLTKTLLRPQLKTLKEDWWNRTSGSGFYKTRRWSLKTFSSLK